MRRLISPRGRHRFHSACRKNNEAAVASVCFLSFWIFQSSDIHVETSMLTRQRRSKGAEIEGHLHWRFAIFILLGYEYQYRVMHIQYQQQQQHDDCIEPSVCPPEDHCCVCFWLFSSHTSVSCVLLECPLFTYLHNWLRRRKSCTRSSYAPL